MSTSKVPDTSDHALKLPFWMLSNEQIRSNLNIPKVPEKHTGPLKGVAVLFNPPATLTSFIQYLIETAHWKVEIVGYWTTWEKAPRGFIMLLDQYHGSAIRITKSSIEHDTMNRFWDKMFGVAIAELPLKLAMFNRTPVFTHNMILELWPDTISHINSFSEYALKAASISHNRHRFRYKPNPMYDQHTILLVANYRPVPDTPNMKFQPRQLHDTIIQNRLLYYSTKLLSDNGKTQLVHSAFMTMDSEVVDSTKKAASLDQISNENLC